MFIETYYDDRAAVSGNTSKPVIPYPELSGEELTVWRNYLPIRRQIRNLSSRLYNVPDPAIAEIEKATRCFDRIEIWSRANDPMAVGVIGEENPRYFSIVHWGDAKLTVEQLKRRLRVEKWLLLLTAIGGIGFYAVMLVALAFGG
jgi:hypothetical protein